MKVKFWNWDCLVKTGSYSNGRTAIYLVDMEDGSPVATATINMPDVELEDGEVVIKDYSENSGMFDALFEGGVVESVTRVIVTGYTLSPVCKLSKEFLERMSLV